MNNQYHNCFLVISILFLISKTALTTESVPYKPKISLFKNKTGQKLKDIEVVDFTPDGSVGVGNARNNDKRHQL